MKQLVLRGIVRRSNATRSLVMRSAVMRSIAATCVATLLACGGDSGGGPAGPNNPNNPNVPNNGSLSARIDGVQYSPVAVQVGVSQNPPFIAIGSADAAGRALGIGFSTANGTGTQSIGISSLANANFAQGGAGWLATQSIGSGTITITTLTANRAAGTFTLTLEATDAGTNPQTRQITQGVFDVTF